MKTRKQKVLSTLFFFCISLTSIAQNKFTISGNIKDGNKGEEIIAASVKVKGQNLGTRSNEYGFYSISLPEGDYTIVIYALGFTSIEKEISLDKNIQLDIALEPVKTDKTQELVEVVVSTAKKDENIRQSTMGVERLDTREIAKIPVLFGEKDIIKTLQLLPGVKSAGEGNSGFFVRGGAADQNLILLDEAPVYNASHLLGFFSTFNSDAIKDAVIYKGNQPSNFGGRLSSVLDIRMNEGNNKRFNVGGGIGLIASRLAVEGPIVKEKGSFLLSGRRTYADVFLKLNEDFKDNKLFFYDLNAKLNYKISKKDKLYLSGYFGRDVLGVGESFGFSWGNATGTLRWNRVISDKLFSNTSLIYSAYDYKIMIKSGDVDFNIVSRIKDINFKQEFQYFLNTKNKIKYGLNVIHHTITPGQIEAESTAGLNFNNQKPSKSLEYAAYINNEWSLNESFTINYGLRLSAFSVLGNGDNYYFYDEEGKVKDTTLLKNNSFQKTYFVPEPRISMSYAVNTNTSIKLAYSRNAQYIHLLSNSSTSSPTDVWMGTSLNTKPEMADQLALGWFKNLKENQYELNIEGYYKQLYNQIDFRNGADINANEILEGELLYGIGRAYGIEFIIKKKIGKLSGWFGYTLSKTERKIEGINNNEWYNARQDRTHDLSLVVIYDLSPKISLSCLFVFYTGNAVTFPSGKYQVDGQTQYSFTERNESRMPNYHRMDLGLTWNLKNKEKFESSLNFSIYNVYARENAYVINFKQNEDNPEKTEAVQLSLFRLVPAITYNFKFK
ncbi:MAG: TonB-dependent receptor [Flavobacteriia bacterium]|nr:TonB-dependent receptor [Flavobacteriia bacterium]